METHQSPLDMFQYKIKSDDVPNSCSSNIDERVSNTERLVDKIREELEQTREANHNSDELISQEETERKLLEKLELELAAKERQIATLVIETQKLQSTLIKVKETSFSQISDLENVVNGKEKLIEQLESKLQSQADYDEIKRELAVLKSLDYHSDQTENSSKKFLEQNRTIRTEQKTNDSESNKTISHSCRHCTSPCLHRTNPSLLSSSASSSSKSSSSPSSPTQIYSKPHSTLNCNGNDEALPRKLSETSPKFISPTSLAILTNKDNIALGNPLTNTKYPSITSTSCSTMVTPTASLLSSVTTSSSTPSSLFPGHQFSSVQCTKLHCPPTSSWSPPLSSSSTLTNLATTSTDNRTVIKSITQSSPKPSSSPTILIPSSCPPVMTTNTTTITSNNTATSLLEPLDTNYVANVVRKLLAQHNIGQRIFARYILSLSQGTVSELLSKPKSWSKLTEKGKESYRKMWCWANSEESILALKSISPRKGMNNRSKDNPYPAVSTKHTDPATHQKIVQILADAQKQQMAAAVAAATAAANMDQKPSLSPCSSLLNDPSNPMPSSDPLQSKSPSPSPSTDSSAANSPVNESTPTDQKSFSLPVPPPAPSTSAASLSMFSAFVPSLLMRTANGFNSDSTSTSNPTITGNLIDCSNTSPFNLLCHQPDNYRNWLMLQEIVRNNDLLKQFQPTFPPIQPIITDTEHESEQDNDDDDDDDDDGDDDDGDEEENEDGNDQEDLDEENPTSSDEIPLDLSMKIDANHSNDLDQTSTSICNSKFQTSSSSSSSTKHVKTALTSLREQDIAKYRYVNTMELVQTVKDILSRYSISQRHFGEKILGLSQGSVSDILARPKQWELLTQKGREPFLRMRIFLDDPNAIKQLVQTVSTTPTTNTNSILLPTFCPPLPPTSLPSSLLTTPSLLSNGFHTNNLLTRDNSIDSQTNILSNDSTPIVANEILPSSNSPTNGLTSNSSKPKSRSKNSKISNDKSTNQSRSSSTNPLMPPYELPKITLPNSIDTEQLSSQVRELLFAYSIGQRVFGEAVLNLSQGTVSEILSKPRPWHSLSVKGREPYIRMYTWYNDTGNVQKLLAWKRERDALRRSRPLVSTRINPDNGENGNTNSLNENSSTTTTASNRPKRRYLFTDEQRRILKQAFQNEPYPSQSTLEQLVNELSLPINKIANWFHNSRMRTKTNIRPNSSPTNANSSSLLPNNDQISDDDDDLDDNNNNNNINNDEDEEDEDDYPIVPTIVPLTSSWLNGTNDSNSSTSPIPYSSTPTNIVSLIDDQKIAPQASSSSSKKRKSVPQKIVTNTNNLSNKKFHSNSPLCELDSHDQTTNESANFVDILT